jgi:Flp pilus assembly protein TadD
MLFRTLFSVYLERLIAAALLAIWQVLKQARSATAIAKNTCSSGLRPRKYPRNSAAIAAVFPVGALAISSVFCDFVTPTSLVLGLVACGGAAETIESKNADDQKEATTDEEFENVGASAYEFYRSVSKTLLRTNQPAQATRTIRRLFKLKPDKAEPYYLMGQAYVAMRQFEAAKKMLQTAVERDPKYADAYATLGITLNMLGKHTEADKAHKKAIELDPNNSGYHNNLGFSYYLQKRYEKAIETYKKALDYDPAARRVHNNLGFAYGGLGKDDEAYSHFKLAGLPAQASNNMGFIYEGREKIEKAYEYYLTAANQDPDLLQARRNLERVCKRLGRPVPQIEMPIKGSTKSGPEPPES